MKIFPTYSLLLPGVAAELFVHAFVRLLWVWRVLSEGRDVS